MESNNSTPSPKSSSFNGIAIAKTICIAALAVWAASAFKEDTSPFIVFFAVFAAFLVFHGAVPSLRAYLASARVIASDEAILVSSLLGSRVLRKGKHRAVPVVATMRTVVPLSSVVVECERSGDASLVTSDGQRVQGRVRISVRIPDDDSAIFAAAASFRTVISDDTEVSKETIAQHVEHWLVHAARSAMIGTRADERRTRFVPAIREQLQELLPLCGLVIETLEFIEATDDA